MKLIIDIPEDLKKMIFDNGMFDIAHSYRLAMCVKNGTPLDDVRAKIADIETYERDGYWVMADVWKILDSIGKADMRGET